MREYVCKQAFFRVYDDDDDDIDDIKKRRQLCAVVGAQTCACM